MLILTLRYIFPRVYGFKELLYDLQGGLVAMQNPVEILVAAGKQRRSVPAQHGSSIQGEGVRMTKEDQYWFAPRN